MSGGFQRHLYQFSTRNSSAISGRMNPGTPHFLLSFICRTFGRWPRLLRGPGSHHGRPLIRLSYPPHANLLASGPDCSEIPDVGSTMHGPFHFLVARALHHAWHSFHSWSLVLQQHESLNSLGKNRVVMLRQPRSARALDVIEEDNNYD